LVHVLLILYIQGVLKLKNNSGAKRVKCCVLWYVKLVMLCCKVWTNGLVAVDLPVHKRNKKMGLFDHEENSNESFAVLERV